MKKTLTILCFLILLILPMLVGCTSSPETTAQAAVEEVKSDETNNPVNIIFASKDFMIPTDLAIYHSPDGFYPVNSDIEELFMTFKGQKGDVCMLRMGNLSSAVTRVENAESIIKNFCNAAYYNASEIVFDEIGLYDAFYTMTGVSTTLEDTTVSVFTLIPKNTNEIYSVTFASDGNGTPVISTEDVQIILNSLQKYSGVKLEKNFFYQIFTQFLARQSQELYKYKGNDVIPPLVDEAFCDLDSDKTYYLGLDTGLYTIETLEGEGEILVEDPRFGIRVLLLGYDSANAPIRLPNVTLVHGGGIKTNMGLRIRIVK